ncbi:YARHG domain-containing protein [Pontibacter sp. G13]|uniref:YARHG domain-containing protein n=1 Tax=Pontibacter sp. G13 TaxID=3074898 RepID=UPI00288B72AA|nr:YARHG domain-containing protein [Pontibacter sp. G13]WNJ20494.1 YARHG domain-containing protein [Pontibacter sp. G13]
MNQLVLPLGALMLLLAACGGTHTTTSFHTEPPAHFSFSSFSAAEPLSDPVTSPGDAEILARWNSLDSIYDAVPWAQLVGGDVWFHVAKGSGAKLLKENMKAWPANVKMGLVNLAGEEILPVEYDRIGELGSLEQGVVEVAKHGKVGLWNEDGAWQVPPTLDRIFPALGPQRPLQAQANGKTGILDGTGQLRTHNPNNLPAVWFQDPLTSNFHQHLTWEFSTRPFGDRLVLRSRFHLSADLGDGSFYFHIAPFYLADWEVIPATVSGEKTEFTLEGSSSTYQVEDGAVHISKVEQAWNSLKVLLADFDQYGINGRGYDSEKTVVVSFDGTGKSQDPLMLDNWTDQNCQERAETRFIQDTLVVFRIADFAEANPKYWMAPSYSFWKLQKDGTWQAMKSNRLFSYTAHVELNEQYFRGCFWGEEFRESQDLPGYRESYLSQHLDIEDLDIMRNEIFASYGYRFKSARWQQYFSQFSWYQPRYDDVNDRLSDLEKRNVQFILKYKAQMQGKEADFVNGEWSVWSDAG